SGGDSSRVTEGGVRLMLVTCNNGAERPCKTYVSFKVSTQSPAFNAYSSCPRSFNVTVFCSTLLMGKATEPFSRDHLIVAMGRRRRSCWLRKSGGILCTSKAMILSA